ncbi:MAG: aromatic ring-hydroxylating oxygenase subunit alpha [Rubripirellula sp.]
MIFGLERDDFVSEAVWEKESARIFSASWLCAGRLETLFHAATKDTVRTIQIGKNDIILIYQQDGTIRAYHNLCRHRGTRLVAEETRPLKNSCITCPYHAWTYNTDGELIGTPNMKDVNAFKPTEFGLKSIACVNWCGFVMINLNEKPVNFNSHFAPIIECMSSWQMDKLVLKHTLQYEVEANWKLIFQNYSECYHCPTVHPNLNRLTPYRESSNDLYEGPFLGGPMQLSTGIETISTDGKRVGNPLSSLDRNQQRLVYYYTLFPTMFLSAHPDYVMAHEIHGLEPNRTRILCHFLSERATKEKSLQRAVQQWDEVNREDWEVCELTQQGVQSPAYTPGPYSNLEPMLIAFDRHYRSIMKD